MAQCRERGLPVSTRQNVPKLKIQSRKIAEYKKTVNTKADIRINNQGVIKRSNCIKIAQLGDLGLVLIFINVYLVQYWR